MPIRILIIMIAVLLVGTSDFSRALAQGAASGPNGSQQSASLGPRKQMATIIFAGLAGAILGLSTLSFYGRPQEKLPNIGMGLGVGIISGTIYTTYLAATRPKSYFESFGPQQSDGVSRKMADFHESHRDVISPKLAFEWSF